MVAVQLSEKVIIDGITRLLVFFGTAASILFNALQYFPLLMLGASLVTVIHDYRWLHRPVKLMASLRDSARHRRPVGEVEAANLGQPSLAAVPHDTIANRVISSGPSDEIRGPVQRTSRSNKKAVLTPREEPSGEGQEVRTIPPERNLWFSWRVGTGIIVLFAATFVAIMVLRGTVPGNQVLFRFFANMYLTGTIILRGGPVAIPLLREYVVGEDWVSSRHSLIGLALQQSFPGAQLQLRGVPGRPEGGKFGPRLRHRGRPVVPWDIRPRSRHPAWNERHMGVHPQRAMGEVASSWHQSCSCRSYLHGSLPPAVDWIYG